MCCPARLGCARRGARVVDVQLQGGRVGGSGELATDAAVLVSIGVAAVRRLVLSHVGEEYVYALMSCWVLPLITLRRGQAMSTAWMGAATLPFALLDTVTQK